MVAQIVTMTLLLTVFGVFCICFDYKTERERKNLVLADDKKNVDLESLLEGRWSFLPPQVEHLCTEKCRKHGKPFARLIGTQCQCLCPLNAPDIDLCSGAGPDLCYGFCEDVGFRAGGDCLYNLKCFCFCKRLHKYNVTTVYTTTPSTPLSSRFVSDFIIESKNETLL